jgi:hypothetical protein
MVPQAMANVHPMPAPEKMNLSISQKKRRARGVGRRFSDVVFPLFVP